MVNFDQCFLFFVQVDNMKLIYNNHTRQTSNPEGVDIRVPGFGNSTSVEWLDPSEASPGAYFKDIGNTLTGLGYVRNKSLRGAPYDFRKAPSKYPIKCNIAYT